jgi:hypothetical protein
MALSHILCGCDHPLRRSRTRNLLACDRNLVHSHYGRRDSTDNFRGYSIDGVDVPNLFRQLQY